MEQIMVSVLIPVFDTEKYLRESLDSMRNQTLREIEVICVDDGSSDSSPQILEEFAAADPRFRIFRQNNMGPSDARNWAVRESRGKYLYFMDSDDILELDALRQAVEYAEQNSLDLVCFDAEPFAENNECPEELENFRRSYFRRFDYPGICSGAQMLMRMQNNNDIVVAPWASMLRRELFIPNAMWYYPRIAHADVSYSFLAYLSARRAGYMKKIFFHRRVRPGSIMTGSKLSFHSLSYFCGCKLMTERLLGFSLSQQEKAAAVKYIQVRLNMAQRYYTQMNERERAECISSTGVDAPLYRQMVAMPAEAKEKQKQHHERYVYLSRLLRNINREIKNQESRFRSGKNRSGDKLQKLIGRNQEELIIPMPKHDENRLIRFEQINRQYTFALEKLKSMDAVPSREDRYVLPIREISDLLQNTVNDFRMLAAEERRETISMAEGDRALFAMLVSIRGENEAKYLADSKAANECDKLIQKRITYLQMLLEYCSAARKSILRRRIELYKKEWELAKHSMNSGMEQTKRSRNSNQLNRAWNRFVRAQSRKWQTFRINYRLHYRPARLAMLGFFGLQGIGTSGWRRELLHSRAEWNVSEEYGAEVMVRYQELLDGPRADLEGTRKKLTFDFRTTSMTYGADEYDYFAKGMHWMSAGEKKQVPTHTALRFLADRANIPAAVHAVSRGYLPAAKNDQVNPIVHAEAGRWTDQVLICTRRTGEEIAPVFASARLFQKRSQEFWTAPVDITSGTIGKLKGSFGGTEDAPVIDESVVPDWNQLVDLCMAQHQDAPLGAEMLVWHVQRVNDSYRVVEVNDDMGFVDRDIHGNSLLTAVEKLIDEHQPNSISFGTPVVSGDTVTCTYAVSGMWAAAFPENKTMRISYPGMDLSAIPEGILAIPFIMQIAPYAWIAHAKMEVQACDKQFAECLEGLCIEANELYPALMMSHVLSVKQEHACTNEGDHCSVLCLDQVDASYSAYVHHEEKPEMLAIGDEGKAAAEGLPFGVSYAAIDEKLAVDAFAALGNERHWQDKLLGDLPKLGAAIPMAWKNKSEKLYTSLIDPAFDGRVRFGSTETIYDGYGYTQEEKLTAIAEASTDTAVEASEFI